MICVKGVSFVRVLKELAKHRFPIHIIRFLKLKTARSRINIDHASLNKSPSTKPGEDFQIIDQTWPSLNKAMSLETREDDGVSSVKRKTRIRRPEQHAAVVGHSEGISELFLSNSPDVCMHLHMYQEHWLGGLHCKETRPENEIMTR